MSNQYSVVITGLCKNIEGVNFSAGENVYYDEYGNLSHDNTGKYLGYAIAKDAMIIRPDFIEDSTITRKYGAEIPVNNRVVQINKHTQLVNPLPLKENGVVGGFYHEGKIYFNGYVPNVSESIQNGMLYYYDSNGDYTTNSIGNYLLGLGLQNGIYIFERDEKLPSFYFLSVNVAPLNEIKTGQTRTYTITKYNNDTIVDSTIFTFSIDYMGNATSIVSITGSTNNTVTLKAGSTANKQFKLICTDATNGATKEQLITIKSLI